MNNNLLPHLALDMYVLARGVKSGVYRVCDELFPLLARSNRVRAQLVCRPGDEAKGTAYAMAKGLTTTPLMTFRGSADSGILLSPFGVAPSNWLLDHKLLYAHIVYDLIAINHPDLFSSEASAEVQRIVDSLDEHTTVFVISECTKKDLLTRRPDLTPRQVTVIPLAASFAFKPCTSESDKKEVRRKYGIPDHVPYVLSLATLEIRKNLDRVVEAFVLYLEQNNQSQLHLVLAGMSGWKLEQLNRALAVAHKWRHRIILTGFVDEVHLSALYSDALCFVYLSLYEGFGLPPLEAMACGTPVICADNSSLPEVVGDAGVMVEATDVEGVTDALTRIVSQGDYRNQLSNSGVQRAKQFSWERSAEIIIDTLCHAYERHVRRPRDRVLRILDPGTRVAAAMRPDGRMEANILYYPNGSHGPCFSTSSRVKAGWPRWRDRMAARPGSNLIEGGLRTRGIIKAGNEHQPLITYVTVVRNNAVTLARTIESVQAQTYANVEHIVLDGASTDNTLDVIQGFADRLDYFASERDGGIYDAVNKAVPLARGQLICVLNSDDWLEPDAAEIAAHRMSGAIKAGALLLTGARVKSDNVDVEWPPAFVHPGCYFKCANDCHNGIYATPEAYESSGPYDTSYAIAADFKWIMSCLDARVEFVYTRETTVNYSLGGASGDNEKQISECKRIIQEKFPTLTQSEIAGLYDCFFLFKNTSEAMNYSDRTEFLRNLFVRHASEPEFLQALAWAAIEKVEFARQTGGIAHAVQVSEGGVTDLKTLLRDRLRPYPRLYQVAGYVYSSFRKRQ